MNYNDIISINNFYTVIDVQRKIRSLKTDSWSCHVWPDVSNKTKQNVTDRFHVKSHNWYATQFDPLSKVLLLPEGRIFIYQIFFLPPTGLLQLSPLVRVYLRNTPHCEMVHTTQQFPRCQAPVSLYSWMNPTPAVISNQHHLDPINS